MAVLNYSSLVAAPSSPWRRVQVGAMIGAATAGATAYLSYEAVLQYLAAGRTLIHVEARFALPSRAWTLKLGFAVLALMGGALAGAGAALLPTVVRWRPRTCVLGFAGLYLAGAATAALWVRHVWFPARPANVWRDEVPANRLPITGAIAAGIGLAVTLVGRARVRRAHRPAVDGGET